MRLGIALCFLPSLAFAQDGGLMPDSGTLPCNGITQAGECQGNVVVYCDEENDVLLEIDCVAEYGDVAVCLEIEPEYGVDCALASGEACIYEDENGDFGTFYCQGTGAGCLENPTTAECQASLGACTEAEIAYQGTCVGNHCEVPSGACDDDVLVCEPGKICDEALFICVTDPDHDAGVGTSADAGTGGTGDSGQAGKEEKDGCTCALGTRPGASYLLLLVAAWFIVRRRER
jgi:hypothetical protein